MTEMTSLMRGVDEDPPVEPGVFAGTATEIPEENTKLGIDGDETGPDGEVKGPLRDAGPQMFGDEDDPILDGFPGEDASVVFAGAEEDDTCPVTVGCSSDRTVEGKHSDFDGKRLVAVFATPDEAVEDGKAAGKRAALPLRRSLWSLRALWTTSQRMAEP
jgi:hypothetical protein